MDWIEQKQISFLLYYPTILTWCLTQTIPIINIPLASKRLDLADCVRVFHNVVHALLTKQLGLKDIYALQGLQNFMLFFQIVKPDL